MTDILHDISVKVQREPTSTQFLEFFDPVYAVGVVIPGYGQITITFESDPEMNRGPVPVVTTDFEPSAITVIDHQGQPRLISV